MESSGALPGRSRATLPKPSSKSYTAMGACSGFIAGRSPRVAAAKWSKTCAGVSCAAYRAMLRISPDQGSADSGDGPRIIRPERSLRGIGRVEREDVVDAIVSFRAQQDFEGAGAIVRRSGRPDEVRGSQSNAV